MIIATHATVRRFRRLAERWITADSPACRCRLVKVPRVILLRKEHELLVGQTTTLDQLASVGSAFSTSRQLLSTYFFFYRQVLVASVRTSRPRDDAVKEPNSIPLTTPSGTAAQDRKAKPAIPVQQHCLGQPRTSAQRIAQAQETEFGDPSPTARQDAGDPECFDEAEGYPLTSGVIEPKVKPNY